MAARSGPEEAGNMEYQALEPRVVPEPTLIKLLTRRQVEDKGLGPAIANAVAMAWFRERLSDSDVYQAIFAALAQEHDSRTERADAVLDAIARQLVGYRV